MAVYHGIPAEDPAYEELSWIEEEWRQGRLSTANAVRCARQAINRGSRRTVVEHTPRSTGLLTA